MSLHLHPRVYKLSQESGKWNGDKYANSFAKVQVCKIFHMRDIRIPVEWSSLWIQLPLVALQYIIGKSREPGEVGIKKVLYGEDLAWGPTRYPLMYHFSQKRYPLRIPTFENWYPFHIPSLELCIAFNRCKCSVLRIWINHQTKKFPRHFISHKMHLLARLGLLKGRNNKIT